MAVAVEVPSCVPACRLPACLRIACVLSYVRACLPARVRAPPLVAVVVLLLVVVSMAAVVKVVLVV